MGELRGKFRARSTRGNRPVLGALGGNWFVLMHPRECSALVALGNGKHSSQGNRGFERPGTRTEGS